MKIKRLELKNFKRFTHLVLEGIPDEAKLVLLIGSNGSGKSSVFDAFELINQYFKQEHINKSLQSDYYRKDITEDVIIGMRTESLEFELGEDPFLGYLLPIKKGNFYGRTSFRQIPQLTRKSLGKSNIDFENDSDRPRYFIDRDSRFENDIEKITETILREIFRSENSKEGIKEKYIEPINKSLLNIFGEESATKIQLIEIIPPLEGKIAQINFRKGKSEIHYNYLSAGEKEVFNLLINLLTRAEIYQDTVYFMDEIDLHLNTKLQYNLLKEITENWIPENSQLWTASHSLGFIDYANDFEKGVILDFDDLDFDKDQVIMPSDKSDYQVFEIAVSKDFIDKVFKGRRIVFSENTDTPIYNDLSIENTFFFTAVDKNDAFHKALNFNVNALLDRDYLTDDEIRLIKSTYPNIKILPYYSIENLLFHPDNIEEYSKNKQESFDKSQYIDEIVKVKNEKASDIIYGISKARDGYPFFKSNDFQKELKQFKSDGRNVATYLNSNSFEQFYSVFPAKDYGQSIRTRQNLNKRELAKTNWFKRKIEETLS